MKTDRRNFLKSLGAVGLAGPLQKLQPAIDRARVSIAKRVIKILLPTNGVYVPQITGVPMLDFFLSMDHSIQIKPCGCRCTPEGDLIEGCEEEKRLAKDFGVAWQVISQSIDGKGTYTWQEYKAVRDAVKSYTRHARAVVAIVGEPTGTKHPRTGEEIRL